jgi:integrase
MRRIALKHRNFISPNEKAKSDTIAKIIQIARKERLSYDDFLYICQQVRRKLGLRRPKRERKLPQLLAEAELKRFFRVIQECGDVQHEIMLKFLFFTAVRVSELVRIKVSDVDLGRCKVFIEEAKAPRTAISYFLRAFAWCLKATCKQIQKTDTCSRPAAVDPLHHGGSNRSYRATGSRLGSSSPFILIFSGTR